MAASLVGDGIHKLRHDSYPRGGSFPLKSS